MAHGSPAICIVCQKPQHEIQACFGETEWAWTCSHSERDYQRAMEKLQEKNKAMQELETLCRDIHIGEYDDPNGPYRYKCCDAPSHGPQDKGHTDDCWFEKMQVALHNLDKF